MIQDLLAAGERFAVEFRDDANDQELVEAVVCLANGDGGHLLLGVSDDGTVVGARPRHGETTDTARLAALIANRTIPAVSVAAEVATLDGSQIVVIEVPKGRTVVATTSGVYVRRAIDVQGRPQCVPMPPHEAAARNSRLGSQDLSVIPVGGAGLDDLDRMELQRFRDLAGADGDGMLAELSDRDLLAALGFVTPEGGLTSIIRADPA